MILRLWHKVAPVLSMVVALIVLWYGAAIWLNTHWAEDKAQRAGVTLTITALIADTWSQEKPKLPAPHQVAHEIWKTTVLKKITSKRSLIHHSKITLSSTLLGFALGTVLGIALAVGIVYNRTMDMSVMPWVIASQTIPILAVAPMIIVVLNAVGISGLLPKAIISMYLSFFPVVVGMVMGCAALITCNWTKCAPGMPGAGKLCGICACRHQCPICSPRSKLPWRRRWWARLWVSYRPALWRVWARVCWRAVTMVRPSRSGVR